MWKSVYEQRNNTGQKTAKLLTAITWIKHHERCDPRLDFLGLREPFICNLAARPHTLTDGIRRCQGVKSCRRVSRPQFAARYLADGTWGWHSRAARIMPDRLLIYSNHIYLHQLNDYGCLQVTLIPNFSRNENFFVWSVARPWNARFDTNMTRWERPQLLVDYCCSSRLSKKKHTKLNSNINYIVNALLTHNINFSQCVWNLLDNLGHDSNPNF